jgi:hypothetical protein
MRAPRGSGVVTGIQGHQPFVWYGAISAVPNDCLLGKELDPFCATRAIALSTLEIGTSGA